MPWTIRTPIVKPGTPEALALRMWEHAVLAADPVRCVQTAMAKLSSEQLDQLERAARILVVGGGKAGGPMALGLETSLGILCDKVIGIVNVPEGTEETPRRIRLHHARPAGNNFPTAAGVTGTDEMLQLLQEATPNDIAIVLVSGGGSALMPAPVAGVMLEEKQTITKLLHRSGATIQEMNTVRKHLSRCKGGRLVESFRGISLISLIISDVIGDPIDVIASGITAPDPSTFQDAYDVVTKYRLLESTPPSILKHLSRGVTGEIWDTPKALPHNIHNTIIASNEQSRLAAKEVAVAAGYQVVDLGSFIQGETKEVAKVIAGIAKSIQHGDVPVKRPACLLFGGETTVTLDADAGKGGRNQEFVLAMLAELCDRSMPGVCVLSAGTDGEDGPTNAAGAIAGHETMIAGTSLEFELRDVLARHDAYPYFDRTNGLICTGMTGTNVMDIGIVLID